MSGLRILLVVLLAMGLMLWYALAGAEDADLERGLRETDQAFARVEDTLRELEPTYQQLTRLGRKLALKETFDSIRKGLVVLRAEQVGVARDTSLERRQRLPELRKLVTRADDLLLQATLLQRQVDARWTFIQTSSPLLAESRGLRDELLAYDVESVQGVLRTEIRALADSFAVAEGHARNADAQLAGDLEQGRILCEATLNGLRGLIEEQKRLLARLRAP